MRWLVTVLGVVSALAAGPVNSAHAEPPTRADVLAARLAKDPVQVTDHAPRELPADTAARIRAAVGRLGVPCYVVVGLPGLDERPGELIPLLRDRLGRDGVYLVTDPAGGGTARQYGGSLPVTDAWLAAGRELPYDAGAARHVERFVEILRDPNAGRRIAERWRTPRPERRDLSEERDRREMAALGGGAVLGGLPVLVLLVVRRRIRRARSELR
ncbi:hypothetical protein DPM19_26020 [Actinomadura craniellae]|uniref:TPM domain-containing protein n=1 Tax=Actinomadura craniellae TaxID=2231787 RepID=A0A365GZD3_9ACTN|nr:hypothetical protein [Actinomadura craniellae]RAY12182.1 hypothetical protein DPM19_26020 [Actinomadura craniellae]